MWRWLSGRCARFLAGWYGSVGRGLAVGGSVGTVCPEVFPGQALPRNPLTALREEISSASARAEFLGVYRGNLSALDLLTEISKLVPTKLDVVFDELSIDRQIIRMRVYANTYDSADGLGAEMVFNIKLETASISKGRRNAIGSVEVLAYGTAIIPGKPATTGV